MRSDIAVSTLVLLLTLSATGCGGSSPSTPTGSTPGAPTGVTVLGLQVGVSGNAPATAAPGQTLRFWATALQSDGVTIDATNLAAWQSSNPGVASIAAGGVLTAVADGDASVSATYQGRVAQMNATVRQPGCEASTLSPPTAVFSANTPNGCNSGDYCGEQTIKVTTPLNDCRWTAQVDSLWLSFSPYVQTSTFTPQAAGSGSFTFVVRPNTSPEPRTGHIAVSFTTGEKVMFTATQERPACSYSVSPQTASFASGGGSGFFDITTAPNGCRWDTFNLYVDRVTITSGANGVGAGRVNYRVAANSLGVDLTFPITVRDPDGASPSVTYTIQLAGR